MFPKTTSQRDKVQVRTMSQLSHVESRVEKKNLDSIVQVFCEDCEAGAEGMTGWLALRTGSRHESGFSRSGCDLHGSPLS